jgi:hypothetical protein
VILESREAQDIAGRATEKEVMHSICIVTVQVFLEVPGYW